MTYVNKIVALVAVAFLLSARGSWCAGLTNDQLCHLRGGYKDPVCEISMTLLLSNPEFFDKKTLVVIGYFSEGHVPILFINKYAYEMSDVASGIALEISDKEKFKILLNGVNHGAITVVGDFYKEGVPTYDVGGYKTSGKLIVNEVGRAPGPWGRVSGK